MSDIKILPGDCRDILKTLPDNSVDSVVTDPPYELGFMGKKWDSSGIAYDVSMWGEVLRVLKPGGYLLSFGGTRTYHRMVCAIEDAGFEIRDSIDWVYGSGFPKSLDIGKAVDKLQGNERIEVGERDRTFVDIRRDKETGQDGLHGGVGRERERIKIVDTKGTSEFEGWGTALKPAHEPICVARKPLSEPTVAQNVLKWGTGGINIDGCRVGTDEQITNHSRGAESAVSKGKYGDSCEQETHQTAGQSQGRFPANFIHDGSEVVISQFPVTQSGSVSPEGFKGDYTAQVYGKYANNQIDPETVYADKGSASRFFKTCEFTEDDIPAFIYCAKASRSERDEGFVKQNSQTKHGALPSDWDKSIFKNNNHPTVKPLTLMRYLIKLVTHPGGTVLDPFVGSGTTMVGCVKDSFDGIGIEMCDNHVVIINARVSHALKNSNKQPSLFE